MDREKQNKLALHHIQTNIELEKIYKHIDFINSARIENFVTLEGIKTEILYYIEGLQDETSIVISFQEDESDEILITIVAKNKSELDKILTQCFAKDPSKYYLTDIEEKYFKSARGYLKELLKFRYGFNENTYNEIKDELKREIEEVEG